MNTQLNLETPEQIEINYDIARLGSRFIATLWDTSAIMLLQGMVFGSGLFIASFFDLGEDFVSNWIIALIVLLSFLLLWGYYVIFELIWNGQTLGKRLAGIRTVQQNGYPIGFAQSAIRNIVRIADFLPSLYGLGVLIMFIDKRSRRLGDFAAGTIVVHERTTLSLDNLTSQVVIDQRWLEPSLPNLERLTRDEVEPIRRFLQREASLTNRATLAAQLATRFRERLQLDSLDDGRLQDDTALLRRIVAQYGR